MTEIEHVNFLDETREGLIDIIKRMINDNSIQGVILGCTELPLILTKNELGIPFFNTTAIHVGSIIIHFCLPNILIHEDKFLHRANRAF
jgi:aspartate racemase